MPHAFRSPTSSSLTPRVRAFVGAAALALLARVITELPVTAPVLGEPVAGAPAPAPRRAAVSSAAAASP